MCATSILEYFVLLYPTCSRTLGVGPSVPFNGCWLTLQKGIVGNACELATVEAVQQFSSECVRRCLKQPSGTKSQVLWITTSTLAAKGTVNLSEDKKLRRGDRGQESLEGNWHISKGNWGGALHEIQGSKKQICQEGKNQSIQREVEEQGCFHSESGERRGVS